MSNKKFTTPERIKRAHVNGTYGIATRIYRVMGEETRVTVSVVAIEGDTLYYTTDGVWYATASHKRGEWQEIIPTGNDDYARIEIARFYFDGIANYVDVFLRNDGTAVVMRDDGFTNDIPPVEITYNYGHGDRNMHVARRRGRDAVNFINDAWMNGRQIVFVLAVD